MRFALSFRPFVLYTCLTLSRFCPVPLSRSPTTINTTNVNNISPLFVVISLSWDEGKDAAADAAIETALKRNWVHRGIKLCPYFSTFPTFFAIELLVCAASCTPCEMKLQEPFNISEVFRFSHSIFCSLLSITFFFSFVFFLVTISLSHLDILTDTTVAAPPPSPIRRRVSYYPARVGAGPHAAAGGWYRLWWWWWWCNRGKWERCGRKRLIDGCIA